MQAKPLVDLVVFREGIVGLPLLCGRKIGTQKTLLSSVVKVKLTTLSAVKILDQTKR